MKSLNKVSQTLFIAFFGRIMCSKNCPQLFHDEKAENLLEKIPEEARIVESQYTCVASAARAIEIDKRVNDFLKYNRDGIVIELGVGFATTYYRAKRRPDAWYILDLDNVLDQRRELFGEEDVTYIYASMFDEDWMDELSSKYVNQPVLFIAAGVFHYFSEEKVLSFLRVLKHKFAKSYIVFDVYNKRGMKAVDKYLKKEGFPDVGRYFVNEQAQTLVNDLGGGKTLVLDEKNMFQDIPIKGLEFKTKINMKIAKYYNMVKIVYLRLNKI